MSPDDQQAPEAGRPEEGAEPRGVELHAFRIAGLLALAVIVVSLPLHALLGGGARGKDTSLEAKPATFVGREKCVSCHRAAYESWLGSDHDRAMDLATEETVLGDFDEATFEHEGAQGTVVTRFYRRDGDFFVNTEGPGGEPAVFEITHTFGYEPLQQYLVPFPGGRLQALSVAWDTEAGEWFFLYPGQEIPADDWLHWTRGGQSWNGMCAECHSTNLSKGYDAATDSYETTWSEIDVSCEACHGPGSRHVAWAEIEPMGRPEVEEYGLVVSTGGLDARGQVELCAPCHSRRSELGDYDHTGSQLMDTLLPSLLREGLYWADGQILDEVYVYGSFLQSKMYRNEVRCGDCHDVHSTKLLREGNELCLDCHRADAYDSAEHHFHKKVHEGKPSRGALCVACHMPEQPYMVVDERADHSIRVPRPDLSRDIGVPNACTQSGCHDDRPLQWSLDAYTKWYGQARKPHYGSVLAAAREGRPEAREGLVRLAEDPLYPAIVRATALTLLAAYPGEETLALLKRSLQDEEALVRYTAIDSLPPSAPRELASLVAPLLFDPVRAVRLEAAMELAGAPAELLKPYQREAWERELAEYEKAMAYSLDFSFAGFNLGNLAGNQGQLEEAESYYRAALRVDDLFYPAKSNLAILLNGQGRNEEAETLLREILEAYPERHEVAYSLALLLVEMKRAPEALPFLARASEGLPRSPRVHYNYGLLLQSLGRAEEAERSLARALALDPESLDFLLALADHYLKRGLLLKAGEMADRMIAAHPDVGAGHDLKALVKRSLGPGSSGPR